MNEHKLARALGYFSIGLGLAEIFATRPLARLIGLKGSHGTLRLFGAREIATGIGILASPFVKQRRWVLARVIGDAIDLAFLAFGDKRNGTRTAIAAANVAAVTAADAFCTWQLDSV